MRILKDCSRIDPYESDFGVGIYDDKYNTWLWTDFIYHRNDSTEKLRERTRKACQQYGLTADLDGSLHNWTGSGPSPPFKPSEQEEKTSVGRYACVGNDIWVGSYKACDAHLSEFPLSIHIWKDNDWETGRFCKRLHGSSKTKGGPGIAIEWLEGGRIRDMSVPIDKVAEYARQEDKLLIHCAGGICRSLTTAVICKVVRGTDVFQAIKEVYTSIWSVYHNPPDFRPKTMEDVINWSLGLPCKK